LLAAARLVSEYVMPMAERTYGDAACTVVDRNTATLARWIERCSRPSDRRKTRPRALPMADHISPAPRGRDRAERAGRFMIRSRTRVAKAVPGR
jgi:hypothetical protein